MFRLYIDEVGTDALTNLEKDKHRYLSLTGVAMRIDHARDWLTPSMNWIKGKVFDQDPDQPITFHRKEILGLKGPYQALRDDRKRALFDRAMLRIFTRCEYHVITALIDKQWMLRQNHWSRTHPYHYLMEILVEKYVQYLERQRTIGDIMPESRKGKDGLLQVAYDQVRKDGTDYVSRHRIAAAIRAKTLKFRGKPDNIAGLQLCDLLAHPSHIYTRGRMGHSVQLGPFSSQVCRILVDDKYDRSATTGKIIGYGIKHLPQ